MPGENAPLRVMILAGEVSGDLHGAALLRELRAIVAPRPIEAFGIGGDVLRAEGMELFAHTDQTGVIGLWEVLKRARFFRRLLRTMTRLLDERRPDLVLGIDYPGFNLRMAARAKARGIPVAHYICPQVWAWHRSRIPKIARVLDLLVTIFPFEPALFEGTGLRVVFAGHPLVDQLAALRRAVDEREVPSPESKVQSPKFQVPRPKSHVPRPEVGTGKLANWQTGKPAGKAPAGALPWGEGRRVALFPGSRPNEVRRLLPDILEAARRTDAAVGPCTFLIPTPTDGVRDLVEAEIARIADKPARLTVVRGESRLALLQAEAAVVKSGTSTLEASLLLCPEAIVYRVSSLSYHILKHLITGVKHISLVNILADREVCREFIQDALTPEALAAELVNLLHDSAYRDSMLDAMQKVNDSLGGEGASRRAAEAVAELL